MKGERKETVGIDADGSFGAVYITNLFSITTKWLTKAPQPESLQEEGYFFMGGNSLKLVYMS